MKSASDWADEFAGLTFGLDVEDRILAIQTDALKAAAHSVSEIGRDGRQWVPNSLWDTLAKEHSAIILSLIPKEGE